VAVALGAGLRSGPEADDVPPRYGLALEMALGRRYLLLAGGRLALEMGFHFAYGRFARTVTAMVGQGGGETTVSDLRRVSHYDFSVLQSASYAFARVRPFVQAAAGVGVGHFSTIEPAYEPGDFRSVQLALRGAAGLDVLLPAPDTAVGVDLAYVHPLPASRFTTDAGASIRVFGPRLSAHVRLRHAF
jgi:hypothetical protein